MLFESASVGAEDYKSENEKKKSGLRKNNMQQTKTKICIASILTNTAIVM